MEKFLNFLDPCFKLCRDILFIYLSFLEHTRRATSIPTRFSRIFYYRIKPNCWKLLSHVANVFTETDPAVPGSVYIFDVDRSENVALPPINRPERLRISKHLERTTPLYHTVRTDEDLKADSLLNERRSKHSSRQGPLVSDAAEI